MDLYPCPRLAEIAEARRQFSSIVDQCRARLRLPLACSLDDEELVGWHWDSLTEPEQQQLVEAHAKLQGLLSYYNDFDNMQSESLRREHCQMRVIERRAWKPVLQQTLDRCLAYAKTADPSRGERYPMDPEALEDATRRLVAIRGWDRNWTGAATDLEDGYLRRIITQDVRPRVRAAWIAADGPQGNPEVRQWHRLGMERARRERATVLAGLARPSRKIRLKTGRQDVRTLHDAAIALGRDPQEFAVDHVLKARGEVKAEMADEGEGAAS